MCLLIISGINLWNSDELSLFQNSVDGYNDTANDNDTFNNNYTFNNNLYYPPNR